MDAATDAGQQADQCEELSTDDVCGRCCCDDGDIDLINEQRTDDHTCRPHV